MDFMKKIWVFLVIILSFVVFFNISEYNYSIHREIETKKINHPEFIPTSESAINTSFGFRNLKADIYWLKTIQYIWSNAASAEYKKYLFQMIDLITDLNPNFDKPYKVGLLLLPSHNYRYEDLTDEEIQFYIDQWALLWEKWIKNFCKEDEVKAVFEENDLNKLWKENKYENSCKTYEVPHYLAYLHQYYNKDFEKAYKYYKLASVQKDSLGWAKSMAAIMRWKSWDRIKSSLMFLTMATSLSEDVVGCHDIANILTNHIWGTAIINQREEDLYNPKALESLNNEVKKALPYNPEILLNDTECSIYVNKSLRELNLGYIENANKKFLRNEWRSAWDTEELKETGYLDYIPEDFQTHEEYKAAYIKYDKLNKLDYRFDYDLVYPE